MTTTQDDELGMAELAGDHSKLVVQLWHEADHSGSTAAGDGTAANVISLLEQLLAQVRQDPAALIGFHLAAATRATGPGGARGVQVLGGLAGNSPAVAAMYLTIKAKGQAAYQDVVLAAMADLLHPTQEAPVPLEDLIGENLSEKDVRCD